MSLQPITEYQVPEATARIAQAAFPKNNLCLKIYDTLGPIFRDEDFADLFPRRGQPAEAPFRLALVTVLQFVEGLSDRAAAEAVRARIDWKYLLCLELDDPGFNFSVLCEFRARLLEGGAEDRLFDQLLTRLKEQKLVKARGRQRTDSTHVLAAIRTLNRLERVGETLRAALNALATVVPEWVRENLPSEWVESYGRRVEEYRLPEDGPLRVAYGEQVGADGNRLLDLIYQPGSPPWLREIPAVEILRRTWLINFQMVDGVVHLREKDNIPPSALTIDTPYDPEARYGRKRSITWVGYKVHVTETCDDDLPHVITNIHTGEALTGDNDALPEIHQDLSEKALLPALHLVDTGYVEAKRLVESQRDFGVDLYGPAPGNRFWQSQQGTGFDMSHFKVDWERQVVTCPEGKTSRAWSLQHDTRGNEVISIAFARSDCSNCPSRPLCTKAAGRQRSINLKPQALHEALQQARERQKTPQFKKQYQLRAGIEGTISQGVRAFELRQSRYWGKAKTHLQHLAIGTAMNFVRVGAWLFGLTPEKTRQSVFVRVMQPQLATG